MIQPLHFTQKLALWIIPTLFAITIHEVAHGWMALRLGDKTALLLGRLTVNPIKHIDPFGTIILPLTLFFLGGFIFGWAKPVPITWQNLRHPRRDQALVALAGPMANLLMAIGWAIVTKISLMLSAGSDFWVLLVYMGQVGILINVILCVLNLVPLPPLDGSRIVSAILPQRWAFQYEKIEPYGLFILIVLIGLGLLIPVLSPAIGYIYQLIDWLTF